MIETFQSEHKKLDIFMEPLTSTASVVFVVDRATHHRTQLPACVRINKVGKHGRQSVVRPPRDGFVYFLKTGCAYIVHVCGSNGANRFKITSSARTYAVHKLK